jgi:hypothetical protein
LFAIADDKTAIMFSHRVINDESGVFDFCQVSCLGKQSTTLNTQHAITAIFAPSHNPVYLNHVVACLISSQNNTSARVRVSAQPKHIVFSEKRIASLHCDTLLKNVLMLPLKAAAASLRLHSTTKIIVLSKV